jgi:Domain of unknown function (DUF5916)
VRVAQAPVIDGVLDDDAWTGTAFSLSDWETYNPLYGDRIPQQTTVWAAYDDRYLYFAFRCDDPEPGRIKTSITRRDNIFGDDWVGLSLDALGNGQVAYHMMVNPSGIQMDMLNGASTGEDLAPDWIWDSAGRPTERGYAVEIRLPFQSIRFKGGDEVRMGILFWRRVSRTGSSVASPALQPSKWVFETHQPFFLKSVKAPPAREVIPSATYSRSQERETPGAWAVADHTGDLGVSGKYGLTSTVTLDATVNPDFSQVESDAFQVEVNQRFPIFFSEKRPFFMEGAGIFSLAGNFQGDASMLTAVHTRQIVDPIFGAKLTGSLGNWTFGTLTAVDQFAGRGFEDGDPRDGKNKIFNVARAQVTLKPGSYAGAIATDTEFAGRSNRAVGGDVSWKLTGTQRVSAFVVGSSTTDDVEEPDRNGVAAQMNYGYSTKRMTLAAQFEHFDRGFHMDTAFYNRAGFTAGWGYGEYNFYPDEKRHSWIRRVSPFTFIAGGRDREAGGDELLSVTGVRLRFTRQGFIRVDQIFGREPWQGERYDIGRTRFFSEVQMFRWLSLYANANWGGAVYYDEMDPFQGDSRNYSGGLTFQPSGRFTESVDYQRTVFDRRSTGARVYAVDVINTRSTYQFTKEFFLRAIVQFDSQRERVLTDFLASYELRPGTVVYVGYGGLYEQRDYLDDEWVNGQGNYLATRRGLFFKASYLYRF